MRPALPQCRSFALAPSRSGWLASPLYPDLIGDRHKLNSGQLLEATRPNKSATSSAMRTVPARHSIAPLLCGTLVTACLLATQLQIASAPLQLRPLRARLV